MTSPFKLPDHVRQAGSEIAMQLYDASIDKALGNGCNLEDYPICNRHLIAAYVNGEIESVEAIHICMLRASHKEDQS